VKNAPETFAKNLGKERQIEYFTNEVKGRGSGPGFLATSLWALPLGSG